MTALIVFTPRPLLFAPDARPDFLLSCQKESRQRKGAPAVARLAARAVPCATRSRRGLRNSALRASDSPRPFSATPCVARRRRGLEKRRSVTAFARSLSPAIGFDLPPSAPPSSAAGPGVVGEDCLNRAAASSAAARANEQHREPVWRSQTGGAAGSPSFWFLFLGDARKRNSCVRHEIQRFNNAPRGQQ